MNPRVTSVRTSENYSLNLQFTNGETKTFDVSPYLSKGIFSELRDAELFNTARVFNGTVIWANELDFCPDTLYLEST